MKKLTKLIIATLLFSLMLTGCKQRQEARRPISHSSGTFMKKSVVRNKKLVASEEDLIKAIIKKNSEVEYFASTKGYWYAYDNKNPADTITPKKGDIAFFDYEIKDLDENIIYSELELRPQTYYVDKQDIMMGLRSGIKLMHKSEKVSFLFPSHMGFGYHGDNKKIGVNQPLIVTVTLRDFMPETVYKQRNTAPKVTKETTLKPTTKDSTPAPAVVPVKKPVVVPTKAKDTLK